MDYQSIAVVDTCGGDVTVWHVDVSPNDSGLSRLSGAWVLPPDGLETLKLLTRARYLTATAAGLEACRGAQADDHAGVVDLNRILSNIESEIKRLQKQFENEAAAKRKSTLVPPAWPSLPQRIHLARPPQDANAPKSVAVVLGIARWLESLSLVWESVERQRLVRKYLRREEEDVRPFPIAACGLQARKL